MEVRYRLSNQDVVELVKNKYLEFKDDIRRRIKEFEKTRLCGEDRIFMELIFCILAPQTRAISAWNTTVDLFLSGCIWHCKEFELAEKLRRVRFRFNKSRYVIEARDRYLDGELNLNDFLDGPANIVRHNLYLEIKGLGYKEASHFLRNIGYSFDLAILDRHILKYMKKFNMIVEVPRTLSLRNYLLLEDRFIWLSKYLGLKPAELDLLLWAIETGYVFK